MASHSDLSDPEDTLSGYGGKEIGERGDAWSLDDSDSSPLRKLDRGIIRIIDNQWFVYFLFTFLVLFLLAIFCTNLALTRAYERYKRRIVMVKRITSTPMITSNYYLDQTEDVSKFLYNSFPAYIQKRNSTGAIDQHDYLLLQVQNLKPKPKSNYDIGPSSIALAVQKTPSISGDQIYLPITPNNLVLVPSAQESQTQQAQESNSHSQQTQQSNSQSVVEGVSNPRVQYVPQLQKYFLFYVVSQKSQVTGEMESHLALKTLGEAEWKAGSYIDGWLPAGANNHHIILPDVKQADSAVLFAPPDDEELEKTYLFFGDFPEIRIAKPKNENLDEFEELSAKDGKNILISPRDGYFDSYSVNPGPEPLQLPDKNYLFLYNAVQKVPGYENQNPREFWNFQGTIGYLILDKDDPTKIIHRSTSSILHPEKDWELCDYTTQSPYHTGSVVGLMPNIVSVSGWKRLEQVSQDDEDNLDDRFVIYYSGCGSYIGKAHLKIEWQL